MATQSPAVSFSSGEFAAALLATRDLPARAHLIAEEVVELLPTTVVAIYIYDGEASAPWQCRASLGDFKVQESHIGPDSFLAVIPSSAIPYAVTEPALKREHFAHWDVRRTVTAFACVPLLLDDVLVGALEIASFDHPLDVHDLDEITPILEVSALALATAITDESERLAQLDTITRLTMVYDLEKAFHSTVQMDPLMPIITSKVQDLMNVEAVHLWMVHEDDLLLMHSSGEDPTVAEEMVLPSGEGAPHQAIDGGDVFVLQADDERLAQRNGEHEGAIFTLAAAPIVANGFAVGAIEIVNKKDGVPITETDVFLLATIAETAATALHNASLYEAERKVEVMETLVKVSNEITSTLNLDRVLQVVVNGPMAIIAYERAALALDSAGKLQVKAVSGMPEVVAGNEQVRQLKDILEFCAVSDQPTYVVMKAAGVEAERDEARIKFSKYFAEAGSRAFYAVPLADDQGRLGILSFESSDPDFLGETQFEFIKVLASQATVALRNASLYTEVPFIGVLEPLLQKKQQFMRMEKRRRIGASVLAAAAVLFLVAVPLPMRVVGDAVVAPQTTSQVQAEVDGVVRRVYVHEGDPVTRGTVLADMDDWDYRSALAEAQAKYASALAAMNRALASSDGAEAGIQRVQADYWNAEVGRARARLDHTRFRSPIDGVVATPHIEDMAGRKLEAGDTFAQVINTSHAAIDVAVDESDLPLLQPGESAAVKLDSFPTRKFRGDVDIVSPAGAFLPDSEKHVFYARLSVPNQDGMVRPGMTGLGKVSIGWRSAGYVLFRGFGMWSWNKLWSWFGW